MRFKLFNKIGKHVIPLIFVKAFCRSYYLLVDYTLLYIFGERDVIICLSIPTNAAQLNVPLTKVSLRGYF